MANVFVNSFQEKIWRDKYQYKNETFTEYCNRISGTIFPKDRKRKDKLFEYLKEFKILFGGRTNSNIGTDEKGVTLFNCFINPMVTNPDSLEGILKLAQDYAITLKTEGGVGFCANFLRPANTLIRKIGVTTPGAIKFLELFDKLSEIITSGNVNGSTSYQGAPTKKSIRKGATMVTMSICHPDIEEFITAKATPNRLTKMNMSVLITDAFIYAMKNDLDWDLWFPDIAFDKYDTEWNGDFEQWGSKGYPFVVYKTVKAVYLWDLLLRNTFNRSEPGILFIDNARRMDNLHYLDGCTMHSTNPCVTGNTLVTTDNGLCCVKDIVKGQMIQTTLGFGQVKNITKYDNHDVYRVYFSDGFYQDVTMGHIFHSMFNDQESRKTWNNNIILKDLDEGTFVRKEWYKNYPTINNSFTRDDGLLVGLYLGDGCFSNYQGFNISTNPNEDNIFIYNLCKRLGGNIRIDDAEGNCCRYYFTGLSKYLKKLFQILNIDANTKTFEVKNLLNTNREFILGLIDGLFSSDGDVNLKARYVQVRFTNTSMNIHSLMKHLMFFVKADYKLYLSKKAGEVSYIYGRKVVRKKDCFTGIIENDSILNLYTEIKYLSHKKKNTFLQTAIKAKQLNGVKWKTKIKNIEYIGKETVYDLYEEKADDWNHEGFVSKGCAEIFGNTGKVIYNDKEYLLGDVCDLGSVNITKFYDVKTKEFKTDELLDAVDILIRGLDNIIDISNYPLPIHENAAKLKRKIGVGMLGVGSLMMMMNLRYGCDECINFLDNLLNKIMNKVYQTSALMSKEFGSFALYDKKLLDGGYVKNSGVLSTETIEMIKKYGLRHSALIAIAPTGTLSIVAGNVSGGLEPVFANEFTRWNRVEGEQIDFKYPNVHKGEWFETDYFKEQKIAGEPILISKDKKYRIDKNSGLCKQVTIQDYGYNIAKEKGFKETLGAMDLSVDEHLAVLGVFSKFIDQSSSKTINLPSDISFEAFKKLYGEIHSLGIKGCTTYREGTSIGVLEVDRKKKSKTVRKQQKDFLEVFKDQSDKDVVVQSVKLPEQYPSSGYILRSEGKKWYIHTAFKDKACTRPFAIFVNTNNREDNVVAFNALEKLEELAAKEGLNNGIIEVIKRKYAYQKNPVKICRMLGFLLRHNIRVYKIVKALDNVEEASVGTFVFRIKKFLAQFIKHIDEPTICPDCKEEALIFTEGCYICKQCGYSKCG